MVAEKKPVRCHLSVSLPHNYQGIGRVPPFPKPVVDANGPVASLAFFCKNPKFVEITPPSPDCNSPMCRWFSHTYKPLLYRSAEC
jgi:hypothetical protein